MPALDDEIERLTRRVRDDPRGTVFVGLADALRRSGRHVEGLQVLREGFRLHPDHAAGRVVLARIHLDLGRRGVAMAVLEDVFRGDAANVAAGTMVARLLLEEGRLAEARLVLERLQRAGVADGAVAELAELVRSAGLNGETVRVDAFDQPSLADRLARRGHPERALAIYRRILQANPENTGIRARVTELERVLTESTPAGDGLVEGAPPSPTGPLARYVRLFWSQS